jgi:abortive infection bacteriophage resistance protein
MGATEVFVKRSGMSMTEAFNRAVDDARDEYGHQEGYSGHINSCEFEGDRTSQWKNSSNKKKFIEDLQENAPKRAVYGICLKEPVASKLKTKSIVKRIPQKGTRVYETVYIAYNLSLDQEVIKPQKTITAAIKLAREWTEKNDKRCFVKIDKRLVKGNSTCAEIEPKFDSKKKQGEYLFVGSAPD